MSLRPDSMFPQAGQELLVLYVYDPHTTFVESVGETPLLFAAPKRQHIYSDIRHSKPMSLQCMVRIVVRSFWECSRS